MSWTHFLSYKPKSRTEGHGLPSQMDAIQRLINRCKTVTTQQSPWLQAVQRLTG